MRNHYNVMSCGHFCTVTCKGVSCAWLWWWVADWMIGLTVPYTITHIRKYWQYSAITDVHTSQFTVTRALPFSVFTSRILATDLSQPHCNFKSYMKYSCHRIISFSPLFFNCQFRRLDSQGNGPIRHVETCPDFFFTARVHTTKYTVKILAANTHCKYFLKIVEFSHFFCTRNRLYQRFVQSFVPSHVSTVATFA
jgi:hypothetical protein